MASGPIIRPAMQFKNSPLVSCEKDRARLGESLFEENPNGPSATPTWDSEPASLLFRVLEFFFLRLKPARRFLAGPLESTVGRGRNGPRT
jgi:hypothetical protein